MSAKTRYAVKAPILYTNKALHNWQAWLPAAVEQAHRAVGELES